MREMPCKEQTKDATIQVYGITGPRVIQQTFRVCTGSAIAAFLAVAVFLTLRPYTCVCQEKEKGAPAVPRGGNRGENKLPVRYENGIKIVGEKFFELTIENGILYISKFNLGDGRVASYEADPKEDPNSGEISTSTKDIKQIVYTILELKGKGGYFISDQQIIFVHPGLDSTKIISVGPRDGSRIFTHDGAIFIAPNGSIVATTPATLLMITSHKTVSWTYESMFGKVPPLRRPQVSQGIEEGHADLRDEAIRIKGAKPIKLDINLTDPKDPKVKIVYDEPLNSVPPETLLWRERADSTNPARLDSTVGVPVH
jgi:hypothetical protein